MTSTDTRLDLDAIEARANAATPGPWCTDSWEIYQGTEYVAGAEWIGETCRAGEMDDSRADAEFVAAARTDVPALVAEVRRLRAELAELENAPLCGKTWGANGNEYSPCARREGHEEAYCRSADGNDYFLAAADDCPGCATPAR